MQEYCSDVLMVYRALLKITNRPLRRWWLVVGAPLLLVVLLIGLIDVLYELQTQGGATALRSSGYLRTLSSLLPHLRGLAGVVCVACWWLAAKTVHSIVHGHEEIKLIREPAKLAQAEYLLLISQGWIPTLFSIIASMSADQWLNRSRGTAWQTNPILEASFVISLFALPMLWTFLMMALGIGSPWVNAWFLVFAVLPQIQLPLLILANDNRWAPGNLDEHFYVHTSFTWKYIYLFSWVVMFTALKSFALNRLRLANGLMVVMLLGGFITSWNGPFNWILPISRNLETAFLKGPVNFVLDAMRAVAQAIWHPLGRGYFVKEDGSFGIHFMVPFSFQARWPHEAWVSAPFLNVFWLLLVATVLCSSIPYLLRRQTIRPHTP